MRERGIHLAFLTTSFPLCEGSPSGVFVRRLVENFPASVNATVVTPAGESSCLQPGGYQLHCFRYAPRRWQLLAHQPGGIPVTLKNSRLMRMILPVFIGAMFIACLRVGRKSDVIHANWSVNGVLAGIAGLLLKKPVITTLRGEDVTRAENSRLYGNLLKWCMQTNSMLVAVSEAIYERLVEGYPDCRNKITFVANGVDSDLLKLPLVSERERNNVPFELLTVGSLIPRKNIETIIEAVGRVQEPQRFRLSIVGEGVEQEKLKNIVRNKSLEHVVKFVGSVPPDKIAGFLLKANAFVLASLSEGRPNVVLEAFAAGVPVVASDIEGVRELLGSGDRGLTFQAGDANDLAKQLELLMESKDLQREFAEKGREYIQREELSWFGAGQKYEQIYQKVICK